MERIEETLRLSPLYNNLSQEEKNVILQEILSSLGYISEDKVEEEKKPGLLKRVGGWFKKLF